MRIYKYHQWNRYQWPPLPLKIGDFGDQSYPLRILSLIKTNLDLNTYPGLKIGDFGDPSDPANKTQHAFWV